jgi:hypothetical protein
MGIQILMGKGELEMARERIALHHGGTSGIQNWEKNVITLAGLGWMDSLQSSLGG